MLSSASSTSSGRGSRHGEAVAANAIHPFLTIACKSWRAAGPVECKVEVGVGLVAQWHVAMNLCECGLCQQTHVLLNNDNVCTTSEVPLQCACVCTPTGQTCKLYSCSRVFHFFFDSDTVWFLVASWLCFTISLQCRSGQLL